MYSSATTPAEYFRLHPGPTDDKGRVTANADWKHDVRKGHIVFDDPAVRGLAASYGMRGEELVKFFDEHPDEYAAATARTKRNILRCFATTIADNLDLLPDEVAYIQDSQYTPKATRSYFQNVDVDETVLDSTIYHLVMMGDIQEVILQVEYDKNRLHNRRARAP